MALVTGKNFNTTHQGNNRGGDGSRMNFPASAENVRTKGYGIPTRGDHPSRLVL
jgi:hypothetical protein